MACSKKAPEGRLERRRLLERHFGPFFHALRAVLERKDAGMTTYWMRSLPYGRRNACRLTPQLFIRTGRNSTGSGFAWRWWLERATIEMRRQADRLQVNCFYREFRAMALDFMAKDRIISKSSPAGPKGSLAPFRLRPEGVFLRDTL
jgi:hypothetical protein